MSSLVSMDCADSQKADANFEEAPGNEEVEIDQSIENTGSLEALCIDAQVTNASITQHSEFGPGMIKHGVHTQNGSGDAAHTQNTKILATEKRTEEKSDQYTIYKSMNFMSFSTRMDMLRNMAEIKVVDKNPKQAVHIVDTAPPELSNKKCQIMKYWSKDHLAIPMKIQKIKKADTVREVYDREKPSCSSSYDGTMSHCFGVNQDFDGRKYRKLSRPHVEEPSDPESDAAETLMALANSHHKLHHGEKNKGIKLEPVSPAESAQSSHAWSDPALSQLQQDEGYQIEIPASMLAVLGYQRTCEKSLSACQRKELDFDEFAKNFHSISHDTIGNPIHKCTVCNKVFTVYEAYYGHVYSHYKHRNKCFVCGKIFTRSWLLKGHMRTHTGERPYKCEFPGCYRAFADRSNLRSHMMIHQTKDKGFVCDRCHRAFAQKRYLHKHQLEVCKVSSPSKCTPVPMGLPVANTSCASFDDQVSDDAVDLQSPKTESSVEDSEDTVAPIPLHLEAFEEKEAI